MKEKLTLNVPYCPQCQLKRSDGTKFCFKCGFQLVEGIRTCKCGYDEIWPHETFCSMCGFAAVDLPTLETSETVHITEVQ